MKGISSANFLFSPSFEKFIDIDWGKAEFVIKDSKDEKVTGRIPHGMISISFKGSTIFLDVSLLLLSTKYKRRYTFLRFTEANIIIQSS